LRILARTPGVSAIAVLSLALGIGANAAIFSLVDRVILSILPVKQPERLVLFDYVLPYLRYKEFRNRSQAFSGLAGPPVSQAFDSTEATIPKIRLPAVLSPEITLRFSEFSPSSAAHCRTPMIPTRVLIPKWSSAMRFGEAVFTQIQPSLARLSAWAQDV
jgi:hypothetical protein